MYAVIFEVEVHEEGKEAYLAIAARLKAQLTDAEGFISIERFSSLVHENKLLSLSFWESEAAISAWKANLDHLAAQTEGRARLFKDYRIRVAKVERDYGMQTSPQTGL